MQTMANVSAGRTEDFLQTTRDVSDYLDTLPLTNEQNNKLIELLCKNVIAAERGAYILGINIAAHAAALAARENRQPVEEDFIAALVAYDAMSETEDV